jgi:hypothetical protein
MVMRVATRVKLISQSVYHRAYVHIFIYHFKYVYILILRYYYSMYVTHRVIISYKIEYVHILYV